VSSKLQTIVKVIQTFGFIELFRLVIRKFSYETIQNSSSASAIYMEFNTIDQILTQLDLDLIGFKGEDLKNIRTEFNKVFDNSISKNRLSFFDSEYDIGYELAFLTYSLIRIFHPKLVVETGVAAGRSSSLILSALKANNYGTLQSFDITEKVGELIPNELLYLWKLKVLKGLSLKNKFRNEISKISNDFIFLHDSNHDLEWQKFELFTCISSRKCKFFLIDDASPALVDFLKDYFNANNIFLIQEERKISAFGYLK